VSGPSQSIKLRALASSVRLRWIYPCDTKVRRFMNDWQPKGRFRSWIWRVGVCASTMAYAGLIPGVAEYAIDRAAVAGLRRRFGPETADCLPVFFIGAIGYRRKMVVAWMDRQGNCAAVGKLPLGRLAAQALGDEAMAISGPASKLGIAMPALIRWDETTGFQLQSALPGRMCYEPFGERHTALLVKMVSPAPLAVETVYSGLLNSKDRRVAEQAKFLLAEHTGESVRPAIVHGDFTQSNLKNIAGNELAILDWEYYSPRGAALADAAYFQLFLAISCAASPGRHYWTMFCALLTTNCLLACARWQQSVCRSVIALPVLDY